MTSEKAAKAKVCAIVGAGDYIGSAIARRFAREGYIVVAGRRGADKLKPLCEEIEEAGGTLVARSLDARSEEAVDEFIGAAAGLGVLSVVIFNVGGNVNFPIADTTERVFRKVWQMACYGGFLTGRAAARVMLKQGSGSIFFTGATASKRGGAGYGAFASAKFGLRGLTQAMARELGPENIHVAHLVIDSAVDTKWVRQLITERAGEEGLAQTPLLEPASIAETYWMLHNQPKDCWTHEMDVRPNNENF